jgi:hypothetical protein
LDEEGRQSLAVPPVPPEPVDIRTHSDVEVLSYAAPRSVRGTGAAWEDPEGCEIEQEWDLTLPDETI